LGAGLNPARRKFYFREDFESNLYPQQAAIRAVLREREAWRADQQAKDWVGQPIARVLGLDLELKAKR
jgi:hypothetical protein